MHDAVLVRGFERFGDLLGHRQGFVQRKGSLRDALGERRAVDELQHQGAIFDAVDLRDVRMVERGQHLRLALKSRNAIGIEGKQLRQNFDRDVAIQPRIARAIHLAHSAGTYQRQDFVRAETSTRSQSHDALSPLSGSFVACRGGPVYCAPMLGTTNIVAFVAIADYDKSRAFYEGILGLTFLKNDGFAMVMDANGIMVRFVKLPAIAPQKFTVLGWQVTDIERQVADLQSRGVQFERFGFFEQDALGIWTAPGGDKVAWFKDPDGNVLSVSQHT
jgi:catechol 2,3-dioxygenase-like lactoylglutathione lyase family enzyme